jgi:hypothetical protein
MEKELNVTIRPAENRASLSLELYAAFPMMVPPERETMARKFGDMTVTTQLSIKSPSTVVTMILALPSTVAVTALSVTVATSVFFDTHLTALFVAFSGATVAVIVSTSPTLS